VIVHSDSDNSNFLKTIFIGAPCFNLLHINGQFININVPEWRLPEISAYALVTAQVSIHGSNGGSPAEIEEMLNFVAEKKR
jgi:D-arabinose 1-dehydrogenase-like Zn-dependent alcohol dehydrogenase